ncbi:MAG TPA: sugar phosphate isomerase/epimerase family protein [Candidatus Dormibacteraeota bacterium]|nr:sugar phosphate isomerase/epimerase family protein [Candidatus Dormibacteraeota bacterium]
MPTQRVLSTYLFLNRKLTPALLTEIASAKFSAIELFCSHSHFDYRSPVDVRELASALSGNNLRLHSLHSPTGRDFLPGRESGVPLSICAQERMRRLDAVDEIKRAIDVAEQIPFSFLIQHFGTSRDTIDDRKKDAAFSSLEHLVIFAKQRGVTIALENTVSEMGSPASLRSFIEETKLSGLRLCFDIGHANVEEGPADERVARSFEVMREHVATTHIHDNHGDKDEHLLPYEGSIEWPAALAMLSGAPTPNLPLVLELKELPSSASGYPDGGAITNTLAGARGVLDKFEEILQKPR